MRVENVRRHRIPWLAVLITLLWVLIFAGILHTAASFKPRYEQVMETYMDMQDRLDQMESELDVVKADLNCDGLVDQGDLDLLFNYILRRPGEYPTERMDFTGDGRINSSDLNALYEIVEALHD